MAALPHRGVTVNRLRIRCRMDPVTARLRAGWLLDESALQPAGLPPSAILCIRRLKDPRPGVVQLDHVSGAPRPPRAWSDLVADAVATLARSAERPGRGDVAGDAEAVLFADRAELLACLAADWCAGRLASRWWSRELLKDFGDSRSVLRAWLEAPAYIAAAFDELAHRGAATAFVERLSAPDTRALLDAIVVQHALGSLAPALEPTAQHDRRDRGALDGDARRVAARSGGGVSAIDAAPIAPWAERVPESVSGALRADQQCLLGIALMTRRAPTVVRSARFAEDVRQWRTAIEWTRPASDLLSRTSAVSNDLDAQEDGSPAARARTDETLLGADANRESPAPPAGRGEPRDSAVAASVRREQTMRTPGVETVEQCEAAAPPVIAPSAPVPPHDRAASAALAEDRIDRAEQRVLNPLSSMAHSTGPLPTSEPIEARGAPAAGSQAASPVARAYPASIDTQIGGVFYLLNVAIALGLYADFTMPMQPGIDLSIWDFLTLAGRRLTPPRFHDDAVWAVLANLAGRHPGENAGAAIALNDRSARAVRRLLPCIRARLARVRHAVVRRRAGALLCVHRATVLASATHIDVMFSLAELPIAIRLSGLDRNPGWIPAADRVIAFHYD